MAECAHLERTSAYFDGALPAGDEAAAVAHLETCAECQAFLRDAAVLDAVLSEAPARAQDHVGAPPRRRRWPIGVAAVGIAAAAALALWIALAPPERPGEPPELAIVLPPARALEARFTGERFAAHRPYDPLRGDRAHEPIALATLAELERRGDTADLVAALAATGDLSRAGELAARRPAGPAADTDRAALALAAGDAEAALEHAYRAIDHASDRAPARPSELAAAWWNLALAAHAHGLLHVSRAAFAAVAARGEAGWADEARSQIAALDHELASPGISVTALRGRAIVHRALGHAALARAETAEADATGAPPPAGASGRPDRRDL